MERILIIILSAAFGIVFFLWFSMALKKDHLRKFIFSHLWLMHPNAICYWRTGMAFFGVGLYFYTSLQALAIFIFTFAAILDGVDGMVARGCNLGSPWGEWLDPLCDKLTYLPPMIGFAYGGILSVELVWVLTAVELMGQFFARKILSLIKFSVAANNFGKIKAIICFCLVILSACLDVNPDMINIADGILTGCIVLSFASMIFKFIPNHCYADILSGLNLTAGITGLVLAVNNHLVWAICAIVTGQLFGLFDGRLPHKTGKSEYGPHLDILADFFSFGIVPACVIIQKGGVLAWEVALIYIVAVGLKRARLQHKYDSKSDLPEGVFRGLPCPAGALIVLGATLVFPPTWMWLFAGFSAWLMVSHIRFAHFRRVFLTQIPKPLYFLFAAAIIVILAYIFKTKDIQIFGSLILCSVALYIAASRVWVRR